MLQADTGTDQTDAMEFCRLKQELPSQQLLLSELTYPLLLFLLILLFLLKRIRDLEERF